MIRRETIASVVGGMVSGYIVWLLAISIGDAITTVSRWSVIVLILSGVLAIGAGVWGSRLRRRRNYPGAAFVFSLPILPLLLSLGVVIDAYL